MSKRQEHQNVHREASSTPPTDLDWEQEKTKVKVRQFMNILEQLPRLCSPTICGTLSQPTTRAERASRGADNFEWSLEQKAILSPANITTDMDATCDWQNLADLNPSWRQQESETFFSQRTIAPSPIVTPSTRILGSRRSNCSRMVQGLIYDEEDEDEENERFNNNNANDNQEAQDLTMNRNFDLKISQSSKLLSYEFEEDDHSSPERTDNNINMVDGDDDDRISDIDDDDGNNDQKVEQDEYMDDLFFSPQPLKSSQTQQRMDIFSPETFVRVMEDEHTLQSTPKTTGSSQRVRTRTRADMLD